MNILKEETSRHEANTRTDTSSVSSDLRLAKRMKPTVSPTATTKYKGVVQQQNGHWGAQIYADHKRIWLGTFKSAAEAAAAYDSASIKLRGFDANSHRNFPWSEITVHEPDFQNNHTTEAVLNMIRDSTYVKKFSDHLQVRSQMVAIANINMVGSKQSLGGGGVQESTKCFSCTELFNKELTPSDVGKLNRLVIPKKHAVRHLPFITDEREEGETGGGGAVDDVEVVFYDRAMRQWKFRYCYWKSSQSFVFTRGWNGFVKEKNLKEKDVIVFYTCDVPSNFKTLEGQSNSFLMIDVDYFTEKGSVEPKGVNKMVRNVSEEEMKTKNFFSSKLEEETKSEVKKGGFMLFGVRIQ
ncbi:AP2/ERF and B3 domain-containing transcription factor [Raphanus sativus]|uniref:AP2/ERF and B3 domain-containing transcription factor At1g51120-like n=1 Tax=Raphanus sativus TaxID=3726 RepID=A0A6J0NWI8_RAPSA|nr:AP2/ERF and B3 domain-containing transcription factor At1g51120-like [Raphanus sativus]KAJ4896634.1 AP2/ERF and B3 domain-containing transcription factor [Raphanus sativus]